MIFSQSCPICFLFLLTLLHLDLYFGYFPFFFSFYIQLSDSFFGFLLRTPYLLDISLVFLQHISNFHFYFMSSFSEHSIFWIFSLSFFNICPISRHSPAICFDLTIKFGYISLRSALYVQSLSMNT